MPIYAAYGSNMDPEQMLQRAPHSPTAGTGWLMDWRLTFAGEDLGWEGALATVVEDPGSQVFVVLYDMSLQDERS
ncbi:MAG: gamma-glutamylcyclotransferase family protein, partial [Mycobacteriaceae bacterium]